MKRPEDYIHALGRFSGAPGLHRIRALLAALGDPQRALRFVHLAGTNGKGSTAAMTAEIVLRAGYRVGLFTSPYLVAFEERIRVNGEMIGQDDLARLTDRVRAAVSMLSLPEGEHIGEFEFVTAVGMLYFVERACDLVVLETGLGGEFDATNAIDPPLVAAITSISLDHTAVLGDTVEQIARTKAGIIKQGSTVVCAYGQPDGARCEIEAVCARVGASLTIPVPATEVECGLDGSHFCAAGHTYRLSLIGRHQVDNALTVLAIVGALRDRGFFLPEDAVRDGLAGTRFAGRLERVSTAPLTLLDGAHNPGGVAALTDTLDTLIGKRRLLLVMGMVRDKAVESCVAALATRATAFFACAPNNERALPADALAALAARDCTEVHVCESVAHAYTAARRNATESDCILICGSLYLVGEAEKIFTTRQNMAQ